MRFFTSDFFFFVNRLDSTAKNMPKSEEVKLSSCGFEVADFRKNCDCGVATVAQHFFKKLRNISLKSCGIAMAHSKKKVARAHLWLY
jgi:hypothetical protein